MILGSLRLTAMAATLAGLGAALSFGLTQAEAPMSARVFQVGWLCVSVLAVAIAPLTNRLAAELVGLFALLVGWRISALIGADLVMHVLIAAFLCYLIGFFRTAIRSLSGGAGADDPFAAMGPVDWHLTFLRLYVGLDFVPHFTEKLFAGPGPRNDDVTAFQTMGLGDLSGPLVWLGGLCEFGAAVGIGLGLLTRFAAIGTTLYLMIATIVGGHFAVGFIWASPGGGWEYPLFWMVIVFSFAYRGAGPYSLDGAILRSWSIPGWLGTLMGGQDRSGRA